MSCLVSWPESTWSIVIHTARFVLALLTLGATKCEENVGLEAIWIVIFTVLQSTLPTGIENINSWLRNVKHWLGYQYLLIGLTRFYPSRYERKETWLVYSTISLSKNKNPGKASLIVQNLIRMLWTSIFHQKTRNVYNINEKNLSRTLRECSKLLWGSERVIVIFLWWFGHFLPLQS